MERVEDNPPTRAGGETAADVVAQRTSAALAAVAALASALSVVFWRVFHRDAPEAVGNLRGTALFVLIIAVPVLLAAMHGARRGSLRARLVWTGALGYLAYNAALLCLAPYFNPYFLLFTAMLALSFWALTTQLATYDLARVRAASDAVPRRLVATYLLVCMALFAALWLQAIVPATVRAEVPAVLIALGWRQNPIWVLDFAFTFPLMAVGATWLWQRRAWGYVLGGTLTIMLTLETAGIAIDQVFGHLHDPHAPLAAVPIMAGLTALGLLVSILVLRGIRQDAGGEEADPLSPDVPQAAHVEP